MRLGMFRSFLAKLFFSERADSLSLATIEAKAAAANLVFAAPRAQLLQLLAQLADSNNVMLSGGLVYRI